MMIQSPFCLEDRGIPISSKVFAPRPVLGPAGMTWTLELGLRESIGVPVEETEEIDVDVLLL